MAAIDARPGASSWALRRPARNGDAEAAPRAFAGRGRPQAALLAVAIVALGAFGGTLVGTLIASQSAHRRGACAALHMAAAHGFLDNRQQRVVMRALATAGNPDVEFFPGGFRAMQRACSPRA